MTAHSDKRTNLQTEHILSVSLNYCSQAIYSKLMKSKSTELCNKTCTPFPIIVKDNYGILIYKINKIWLVFLKQKTFR